MAKPKSDSDQSGPPREALAIGDLHGHYDRLEGLLVQEGIIVPCADCDGTGQLYDVGGCNSPYEHEYACTCDLYRECLNCDGDGLHRVNHDIDVILVGDIGHFGKTGSPTGDMLTWRAALNWADYIIWGNHDRAVFESRHVHSGYEAPMHETRNYMKAAFNMGKLKLAHAHDGFLITHAGLHGAFKNQKIDDNLKNDPAAFAAWINMNTMPSPKAGSKNKDKAAIVDAIPRIRGGSAPAGGILWRDISEKLYMGFRQVFGHSADHKSHKVRYCYYDTYSRSRSPHNELPSYCVDIGGANSSGADHCIAGIYLPSERIVTWNG